MLQVQVLLQMLMMPSDLVQLLVLLQVPLLVLMQKVQLMVLLQVSLLLLLMVLMLLLLVLMLLLALVLVRPVLLTVAGQAWVAPFAGAGALTGAWHPHANREASQCLMTAYG